MRALIEPQVGQFWVHRERGIELCIEVVYPESKGVRARWTSTTGFVSLTTLRRNYRYDRVEPKTILEPFGELYSDMTAKIIDALEVMSHAELISTLDAAEALDDHCWWATWNVRKEVLGEARRVLYNKRPRFERSMCGKVTIHLPHMWDCHGGYHAVPGHYYCKGSERRERAARLPIPTKISLPAGY